MKTFTANEAKQSFGELLDTARVEPVMIEKHKRRAAVVISIEEYDRLRGMNVTEFNNLCDRVGRRAKELGLTEDKLNDLLRD
ncbi:MAG: type II toxin-antitoxin system prevent-host-death family antitoxin [Puniceicoccales bacterium]